VVDGRRNHLDGRRRRRRLGPVARRRSAPPPSNEPVVDPRRVGVGQLRHEATVDERQQVPAGRVVEMTAATAVSGDRAPRVVNYRGRAATSDAYRER